MSMFLLRVIAAFFRNLLFGLSCVVYGVCFLVSQIWTLGRRARWGVRLLRNAVPCGYCSEPVPLTGRFECKSPGCGATFAGFLGACSMCGSGCLWTPCPGCGASVQVGMRI
jgi:hypothetical protein